jgi:site-specific DNA-methyltransferase (adenine-specific)
MAPPQRLIIGDSRDLPEIEDASVHLVVTSPPYWQLKDYGVAGQIGYRQDLQEYHDALEAVWRTCARVLLPGCRFCVNIGDQFARREVYGRYKVVPLHGEIIRRIEGLGLDFMGSVIWQKVTTCNSSGGGALMGSYPYPRNGVIKLDYEYVLLFKKPGKAPAPTAEGKEEARMSLEEWKSWFTGHWQFPGARTHAHLAPFPVELPRRLMRMFTFPGERVLDPFVGSGTTLVAAAELEREGIGVDLDPGVESVVRSRIEGDEEKGLFPASGCRLDVTRRAGPHRDVEGDAGDESQANAASDEPAGFFGSVIRQEDRGRQRHAGVRDLLDAVTGPVTFRTRGGRELRLLGVAPRPGHRERAQRRLEELLSGRAFLLTDPEGRDLPDGASEAYVHLLDRTFVNSRLLREGLLMTDRNAPEHPHRAKFLREEARVREGT